MKLPLCSREENELLREVMEVVEDLPEEFCVSLSNSSKFVRRPLAAIDGLNLQLPRRRRT